jgi:hypothetical protein
MKMGQAAKVEGGHNQEWALEEGVLKKVAEAD